MNYKIITVFNYNPEIDIHCYLKYKFLILYKSMAVSVHTRDGKNCVRQLDVPHESLLTPVTRVGSRVRKLEQRRF